MIKVLSGAWALLLGMMLLQVGNGMQSTLLGVRGEIEGFSTFAMSLAFWLFGGAIIDILTTSPEGREAARLFLPWMILMPVQTLVFSGGH